jgi:hypothetical protein
MKLTRRSASHEVDDQGNDSNDNQDMDETAGHVNRDPEDQPERKKDKKQARNI